MKQRLVLLSFFVSVLIMIAKFAVYYASGSTTLLTDALESIINVVAACFAYYSIYFIASSDTNSNKLETYIRRFSQ